MTFSEHGFELLTDFLNDKQLEKIRSDVSQAVLKKSSGGIRDAEKMFASVDQLVNSEYALTQAARYLHNLPHPPHFIKAILFNKTPKNNWLVALHQDKTVMLTNKIHDPAWGPWRCKDGVFHVQPPVAVLNAMVTFRIHLDDTSTENGCLAVIPGSHQQSILSSADIANMATTASLVKCPAPAGSALVMRPHLLHASSKATAPSQRRVLHLEYCNYALPQETSWASNV